VSGIGGAGVCDTSVELASPYPQRDGQALALVHCDEWTRGGPHFKSRDALPVNVIAILKPAVDLRDPIDVRDQGKGQKRVSRIVGCELIRISVLPA
jgi:hypothetical protein